MQCGEQGCFLWHTCICFFCFRKDNWWTCVGTLVGFRSPTNALWIALLWRRTNGSFGVPPGLCETPEEEKNIDKAHLQYQAFEHQTRMFGSIVSPLLHPLRMAWNIQKCIKCIKSESEKKLLEVKKNWKKKKKKKFPKTKVAQNCLSCAEIRFGGRERHGQRTTDRRHRRVTSRVPPCSSKARLKMNDTNTSESDLKSLQAKKRIWATGLKFICLMRGSLFLPFAAELSAVFWSNIDILKTSSNLPQILFRPAFSFVSSRVSRLPRDPHMQDLLRGWCFRTLVSSNAGSKHDRPSKAWPLHSPLMDRTFLRIPGGNVAQTGRTSHLSWHKSAEVMSSEKRNFLHGTAGYM